MLARVLLKKGCIVPSTAITTNNTYVLDGALKFWIDGQKIVVHTGEVLCIPAHMPHKAEALEDTVDLDVFNPPRLIGSTRPTNTCGTGNNLRTPCLFPPRLKQGSETSLPQATFRFRCIGCGSVNQCRRPGFPLLAVRQLARITDPSWNSSSLNPAALKTLWHERRSQTHPSTSAASGVFRELSPRPSLSGKSSLCAKAHATL